jgi:hypothetical protein
MTSAPLTTTAIRDVPPARLGVASALPNTSRYTGGALGAAVLSAILHASTPAGASGAAAADGLRWSLLAAVGFVVLAGTLASRMPEAGARAPVQPQLEQPEAQPRGGVLASAAARGGGE